MGLAQEPNSYTPCYRGCTGTWTTNLPGIQTSEVAQGATSEKTSTVFLLLIKQPISSKALQVSCDLAAVWLSRQHPVDNGGDILSPESFHVACEVDRWPHEIWQKTKRKAIHHILAIIVFAFDKYFCGISPSPIVNCWVIGGQLPSKHNFDEVWTRARTGLVQCCSN